MIRGQMGSRQPTPCAGLGPPRQGPGLPQMQGGRLAGKVDAGFACRNQMPTHPQPASDSMDHSAGNFLRFEPAGWGPWGDPLTDWNLETCKTSPNPTWVGTISRPLEVGPRETLQLEQTPSPSTCSILIEPRQPCPESRPSPEYPRQSPLSGQGGAI